MAMTLAGLTLVGCTSTEQPPAPVAPAPAPAVDESFERWRESTGATADDLLAEARELAELGDPAAALDRIDDALCAVLDPPDGVADDPAYLSFVAGLISDAEAIEQDLTLDAGDLGEVVALPPIEIPEDEPELTVPVDPDGLPRSEYPLVLNTTVEEFLATLTREGEYRNRIGTGLARSGAYLPMIRQKLERAGLPDEIAYLPLIESAFSVTAYSRARAHGMWQFISSTGRHYGLEVGSLVDERRDPVLSTDAAIAYLSDLHGEFGDWHLALAAYNSGAGNVRRAIRRSGSRDFWVLKSYLPRETRNYVPAFIASVIIAKDPGRWGFTAPAEQPWTYDRVDVPDALDLQFLADRTGLGIDELRELNPAIRRDLTPAGRTTTLWLPEGRGATVAAVLAGTPSSEWAPRMVHTVRKGESLSTIAARYGSNVSAIKQANGLRGNLIHPGQNLIVPRLGISAEAPEQRAADDGVYVVQPNDTLWDIARSFSVSVDALCAANRLGRRDVIRPGQRLQLPSNATGGPAEASPGPAGPVTWSGTYTVRSGDTLSAIAARHGVSVKELQRANRLAGSRIYPGATLTVPAAGRAAVPSRDGATYRVRKGDTLYDIARQFGVSVSDLRRVNGLTGSQIHPGDVLRIPKTQATG
ncbi:MAG: LysM peptidoglycan-binding domain-containing protein [Thermoanaerobaculales bacterium]|jgi:membrane-bound lytic murein transglycosylase D|nr:LysM peptidoglycan-binding domain-containing protein [Thermoanaerobaculales bacterium]